MEKIKQKSAVDMELLISHDQGKVIQVELWLLFLNFWIGNDIHHLINPGRGI